MHSEAMAWVAEHATTDRVTVLDVGGRYVNGSPRPLFPNAVVYRVLDIADGPDVDVVADAAAWTPDREYDVVVCCETFEHAAEWPRIALAAHKALRPGGRFIATMAGPGRAVHSGVDGGPWLHRGEHYANVAPEALDRALREAGFVQIVIDYQLAPCDVRCVAAKEAAVAEEKPADERSTKKSRAQQRKDLLARRQEAQDAGDGGTVNEVDEQLAELGDD